MKQAHSHRGRERKSRVVKKRRWGFLVRSWRGGAEKQDRFGRLRCNRRKRCRSGSTWHRRSRFRTINGSNMEVWGRIENRTSRPARHCLTKTNLSSKWKGKLSLPCWAMSACHFNERAEMHTENSRNNSFRSCLKCVARFYHHRCGAIADPHGPNDESHKHF